MTVTGLSSCATKRMRINKLNKQTERQRFSHGNSVVGFAEKVPGANRCSERTRTPCVGERRGRLSAPWWSIAGGPGYRSLANHDSRRHSRLCSSAKANPWRRDEAAEPAGAVGRLPLIIPNCSRSWSNWWSRWLGVTRNRSSAGPRSARASWPRNFAGKGIASATARWPNYSIRWDIVCKPMPRL